MTPILFPIPTPSEYLPLALNLESYVCDIKLSFSILQFTHLRHQNKVQKEGMLLRDSR